MSTVFVLVEKPGYAGGLILEMDDTCSWTWRTMRGGRYIPIGRHGGVGRVEDAAESSTSTGTFRCVETTRNDSQGQVRLRNEPAIALYGVNSQAMVVGAWGPRMFAISGRGYLFASADPSFQGDINWRFIEHP